VQPTTPAESVITDPDEAREYLAGQLAVRKALVMSILLDVLIAAGLIAFGIPVAVVAVLAVIIVALSGFALRHIVRTGDARLANFRDPVSGRVNIPGA
jgi:hypothetical protein